MGQQDRAINSEKGREKREGDEEKETISPALKCHFLRSIVGL